MKQATYNAQRAGGGTNTETSRLQGQPSRFDALYDLASEGDEASIHGLWAEFGFDFNKDERPTGSGGGAR